MIEWASPEALLLLPAALLLPLQGWVTGHNRLAVPASSVPERRWTLRLLLAWVPRACQVLGLVLCVVAMARPRITHRDVVLESEGLDILLAVDTSGSMHAEDFAIGTRAVNRLQVAKGVMAEFVQDREHDRIGVVVFGEEAFTHVPLTLDHDTLASVLQHVDIGLAGPSATAIGQAIAVSARRLKQVEAKERIVILLTDGRNNAGDLTPKQAAQMAAALDIRIYTVGIGARATGFRLMGDGLDEDALREIAKITGGQYFRATDSSGLAEIYARIDELETSPAKVRELVEHEELYRKPLLPGMALLFLHLLLGSTLLRRFP